MGERKTCVAELLANVHRTGQWGPQWGPLVGFLEAPGAELGRGLVRGQEALFLAHRVKTCSRSLQ